MRHFAAVPGSDPDIHEHLMLVVNADWFFLSHRLPLAKEALRRGWRVTLVASDTGSADLVRAEGIDFVDLPVSRSGTNPLREIQTVAFLARLYRRLRPSLIHHVTLKPVVYGSLASRSTPDVPVVNAVSGLGYTFISKASWHPLRLVVQQLYALALRRRHLWTIFQNDDDLAHFVDDGLVDPDGAILIRGSGVDVQRFTPTAELSGAPVVVLPARLLRDKGVVEFVEAARQLRAEGSPARFALVGMLDPDNPAGIDEATVERWVATGDIEWWGFRDDMPEVYRQATVVVLPSYREGLPKALLEAGASARTLITTDVPGCRDVVTDDETGLVVPVRDASALAGALRRVLGDSALRGRLRAAARENVVAHHTIEHIVEAHFSAYERILHSAR